MYVCMYVAAATNNPRYSNDESASQRSWCQPNVVQYELGEKFGGSKTVPISQGSCSALPSLRKLTYVCDDNDNDHVFQHIVSEY